MTKKNTQKYISVPLTIALLDDSCSLLNAKEYISEYNIENEIHRTEDYILYKKNGGMSYPKWLLDFQKKILKEPDITNYFSKTIYEGLTLIKRIEYNGTFYTFAINFGQGRHNIDKNKINTNFGIFVAQKILLNKGAKVRIAESRNIEGEPINKNRMFAKEIEQESLFSLLDEDEVMRALSLTADKDSEYFTSLIGKYGPLNIRLKFKPEEIPCMSYLDTKIKKLIDLYNNISDDEIGLLFKGLQPVKKEKSEELFNTLAKNILDNRNKIYLFEPELDYDFMQVDSMEYNLINNNSENITQITEKLDLKEYLQLRNNPTLENLQNDQIVLNDENGRKYKSWSILDTLYGEFSLEDNIYILSNKNWHKVDKNKYNKIDNKIKNISNTSFVLKDEVNKKTKQAIIEYSKTEEYKRTKKIPREGFFNDFFAKTYNYKLFDKKIITLYNDPIEICDIYKPDNNEFIHVKIGTNTENLSHLFAQGYASARAYKVDTEKYIEAIKDKTSIIIPDSKKQATVNYFIINTKKVNELTFLSKMSLIEKIENLEAFGFIVKLTWCNNADIYPKLEATND